MADREQRAVRVEITARHPLPPPQGANFFHFTTVGSEVQMLVGSVNLLRVHEAGRGGESPTITPDITHRFLLSPLGFAQLKKQIDEISKHVQQPSIGIESGTE
jgi:hypothetical protein